MTDEIYNILVSNISFPNISKEEMSKILDVAENIGYYNGEYTNDPNALTSFIDGYLSKQGEIIEKKMIHKLTIKDKEYLLVEVPKDANTFYVNNVGCIRYSHDIRNRQSTAIEPMTLGIYATNENCKIINTISNLTEGECIPIMENDNWSKPYSHLWTKFGVDKKQDFWWVSSAKESFISLLKSKNILAKSFVDEVITHNFGSKQYGSENIFSMTDKELELYNQELKEYQNLSDELLLIQINN